MDKEIHHYRDILDLPDLPEGINYREVSLAEPWNDLSEAWIGSDAFCRVRYRGKMYKNRVYRRRPGGES